MKSALLSRFNTLEYCLPMICVFGLIQRKRVRVLAAHFVMLPKPLGIEAQSFTQFGKDFSHEFA